MRISPSLSGIPDNPSGASREAGSTRGARPPYQAMREEKLAQAKERLVANGLERLIPVLDQIVINGKYRQESIRMLSKIWHVKWEVARRKYYRGSTTLLTLFSPNKIKGETHVETTE